MLTMLATVATAVTLMGALLWVDAARATTAQQRRPATLQRTTVEEHSPMAWHSEARVETQSAGLAVPFIENAGQGDPRVAYYAPTFAGTVFVTRRGEIVHALRSRRDADEGPQPSGWTVTERFVGGRAVPAAAEPSITNVSLFLGSDRARWRAHAPTAAAVSLGEVYVAGSTSSTDFPATSGGAQSTPGGDGDVNAFVARLSAELSICPSMPLNTCLNAERSRVFLRDNPDETKRMVLWKWSKKMTPPVPGDLGDPVDGMTSYLLCIYDDTAAVPTLKMTATVEPGQMCGTAPCWKSVRETGWAYKNKLGNASGITKVRLKIVGAGRLRIRVQGKGDLLPLPAPVSDTKFLNQAPAVTVQLSRTDAPICWSSAFSAAGTKANSGTHFKAHVP